MTHSLPISLLVAASTVHAGWVPDSPLVQVGDNLDIYFTLKGQGHTIWRAKWDALRGLPMILKKRRKVYLALDNDTLRSDLKKAKRLMLSTLPCRGFLLSLPFIPNKMWGDSAF